MSREIKIEVFSSVMSERAYYTARQKLGLISTDLAEQNIELGVAGGTNDFHDNAAFDEASRKIDVTGISYETWRKTIMYPVFIERRVETDSVQLGNLVDIEIVTFGERFKANILGPVDGILFEDDSISFESPLGRALIGHVKGEEIEYEAASRKLKAKIIDVLPGNF